MKLLALDVSTDVCTVALLVDGDIRQASAPGHKPSRGILDMADRLVKEAGIALLDLDGIGFGRGPGAFTGLRVAAGVAQGLALGLDRPVLPISSLAALALRAIERGGTPRVMALLDARMGEIYAGGYQASSAGLLDPVTQEAVMSPSALELPAGDAWTAAGNGWAVYPELRELAGLAGVYEDLAPDAAAVARLAALDLAAGLGQDAAAAIPVYLRNQVAQRKAMS